MAPFCRERRFAIIVSVIALVASGVLILNKTRSVRLDDIYKSLQTIQLEIQPLKGDLSTLRQQPDHQPVHSQGLFTASMKPPYEVNSYLELRKEFMKSNPDMCKKTANWGGSHLAYMYDGSNRIDGNYTVCLDDGVGPRPGSCIMYSFGIRDDWTFDEAMEKHGCQVFAFDPSIGKEDHMHSENISFYNMGTCGYFQGLGDVDIIAPADGNKDGNKKPWKLKTLATISKMLGHQNRTIDILKIDIEGNEHKSIRNIIETGMLDNVRLLIMEIHNFDVNMSGREFYSLPWLIERMGFIKYYANDWPMGNICTHNDPDTNELEIDCYNFSFLNTKYLKN